MATDFFQDLAHVFGMGGPMRTDNKAVNDLGLGSKLQDQVDEETKRRRKQGKLLGSGAEAGLPAGSMAAYSLFGMGR